MSLLFIQNWFSAPLAKTIGWTLVHSLWQGILLTVIAGIFILFTRRSKPTFRYTVLSCLFIGFIACAGITFILEWQAMQDTTNAAITTSVTGQVFTGPGLTLHDNYLLPADGFTHYFNDNASLIVAVWFLIFLAKAIRLAANIGYIQRIRHYKSNVADDWQERINALSALLHIRRFVSLHESAIIKVPLTIGFLKPVIFFPLGLLSNLPPDQVEAILLHELAHIRRKDYLINLLQCFGESIFFFNPAILWLSAQIRQERENCCDDMAIGVTRNKSTFIHALVAFQEYGTNTTWHAPAFPGKSYQLLHRVKRIISNNNKNLNNMEKIFLSSGLVLTAVVALAFSHNEPAREIKDQSTQVAALIPANMEENNAVPWDTVPDKKKSNFSGTVTRSVDQKNYTITFENSQVTELLVNGESIPSEKFAEYKEITSKIMKEVKEEMMKDKEAAERDRRTAEKEKLELRQSQKEMAIEKEMLAKEMAELDRQRANDQEFELKVDSDRSNELKLKYKEDQDNAMINNRVLEKKLIVSQERMNEIRARQLAESDIDKEIELKQNELKELIEAKKARDVEYRESNRQKIKAEADRQDANRAREQMIKDLLSDEIIKDPNHVSINLSNEAFIVNGVKQPEEIFKKYKEKYGIREGRKMNYNINNSNNKSSNSKVQ